MQLFFHSSSPSDTSGTPARGLVHRFRRYLAEVSAIGTLRGLTDYQLADIGIDRQDIPAVVRRNMRSN